MNFIMIHIFLPGKSKIKKLEKLADNFHDEKKYFLHIRCLKQALHHGLVLNKVITFDQFIKFIESLDS